MDFLKNILVKLFWKIKYVPKIYKTIHNVLTKENSIPISFITSENFESYFQSSFKLRSHIPDNNYYSNFEVLQALGIKSDNIYMEHGLYLGNYFSQNLIGSHVKEIITMSDFRVNIAGNNGFEAIPIGPYIHYINSIHGRIVSEDYALAILSHASTKQRTEVNIEIEDYLIKIQKRIQKRIVVLIHPNDSVLLKSQFRNLLITTCGLRNDPDYLRRLKNLISNSSLIITDDIGTHIGYTVYLNKPILKVKKLFNRFIDSNTQSGKYEIMYSKEQLKLEQIKEINSLLPLEEIVHLYKINNIIHELWGFKYLKNISYNEKTNSEK